ncbi:NADH dependent phenylglyoxylate [Paramagnetospirillum caucaseum]|uniref:NADH dependent phenylglyoxylate n=1 Tax=Paramagnetospirillum caucaseum TaxID=1244869 RepID=M3A6T7_9PROT|nr:FAD-dependent oxidoreductase [Paramagnetospirillum caucaseum]EME68518.1 NADH dependent phenylglyoxylate [Paramagnetospirillum caucaseum]
MTESHAKYLIVGASHAGREALAAIRMHDPEGRLVMLSGEKHLPYSPTILPYVVSGRSLPERTALAGAEWFAENRAELVLDARVTGVDPAARAVRLADGRRWTYDRLLLATGAEPVLPPVEGLERVRHHVLRTLDDALALRRHAATARRAVVLGAGLVGLHAAETLAEAGLDVAVVEMRPHVLAEYFDPRASALIRETFERHGIRMLMGRRLERAAGTEPCRLGLDDGTELEADLLLVAAGVRPATAMLAGGPIATDRGILVDPRMRTNAEGVWAAGDVAQADGFLSGRPRVNGTLPEAVEQGRIAGMDMAGDADLVPYGGGLPLNTYGFFGRHAVAVGAAATPEGEGVEVHTDEAGGYCRIVLKDNRLIGLAAIDRLVDGGILWRLIQRRTDLAPVRDRFLSHPLETARALMSQGWR